MRIGVLVGKIKGKFVVVGNPGSDLDGLKKAFKELVLKDGKSGRDQLEDLQLLTTSGRVKRKTFGGGKAALPEKSGEEKELELARATFVARGAELAALERKALEALASKLKISPDEIKTAPDPELVNLVLKAESDPTLLKRVLEFFNL